MNNNIWNNNNYWKITKKVAGVILIILGIIGCFLPVLQGFLLIAIGVTLLGNKLLIEKFKKLKQYLIDKRNR